MGFPAHPIFSGSTFGFISGENPFFRPQVEGGHEALGQMLQQMGLHHEATSGKYGQPERSYIVHNPTSEQMRHLGKLFGQESIVHSQNGQHRLIYTNGEHEGKYNKAHLQNPLEHFEQPPSDYYTTVPGHGHARINFDFDTKHDLDPVSKSEGSQFGEKIHDSPKHTYHVQESSGAHILTAVPKDGGRREHLGQFTRRAQAEAKAQEHAGLNKSEREFDPALAAFLMKHAMGNLLAEQAPGRPHPHAYEWHDGHNTHHQHDHAGPQLPGLAKAESKGVLGQHADDGGDVHYMHEKLPTGGSRTYWQCTGCGVLDPSRKPALTGTVTSLTDAKAVRRPLNPNYGFLQPKSSFSASPKIPGGHLKLVKADAPGIHPHMDASPANPQAAPVGVDTYKQYALPYGNVSPGSKPDLLHYNYHDKLPEIEALVHDHGYKTYYAGGKYGKPDLANKNYNTGHLMVYDPSPQSGASFGHEKYTNAWRQIHELAHALTLPELNRIYGEGRRMGKLGTHRTVHEALRAVHWEWLAAHKQRELSKQIGVPIKDEDFHRELNTVMHDAAHRAVTGKFTEPSGEGFQPHKHKVPLHTALQMVRDAGQKMGLQGLHDRLPKPGFEMRKGWPKDSAENAENFKGFLNHPVAMDNALEQGLGSKGGPVQHTASRPSDGQPANPAAGLSNYQFHAGQTAEANRANAIAGRNPAAPRKWTPQTPFYNITSPNDEYKDKWQDGGPERDFWQDTDAQSRGISVARLRSRAAKKGIKKAEGDPPAPPPAKKPRLPRHQHARFATQVTTRGGPVNLKAAAVGGGLSIHRTLKNDVKPDRPGIEPHGVWALTHEPSGLMVAHHNDFDQLSVLRDALMEQADWTQDANGIREQVRAKPHIKDLISQLSMRKIVKSEFWDAIFPQTEGDTPVADEKLYTPEEAREILIKATREKVSAYAKEIEALQVRELKKALIPNHKHNEAIQAGAGIEDVPPGKVNPKGVDKMEKQMPPPAPSAKPVAPPPRPVPSAVQKSVPLDASGTGSSPVSMDKAELCKKCGKSHDMKKGCEMEKAVDKMVVHGEKSPAPAPKGADYDVKKEKGKAVFEAKKSELVDAKGKRTDNHTNPDSTTPDDKKSVHVNKPGKSSKTAGSGGVILPGSKLKKAASREEIWGAQDKKEKSKAADAKTQKDHEEMVNKRRNSGPMAKAAGPASPPTAKPPSGAMGGVPTSAPKAPSMKVPTMKAELDKATPALHARMAQETGMVKPKPNYVKPPTGSTSTTPTLGDRMARETGMKKEGLEKGYVSPSAKHGSTKSAGPVPAPKPVSDADHAADRKAAGLEKGIFSDAAKQADPASALHAAKTNIAPKAKLPTPAQHEDRAAGFQAAAGGAFAPPPQAPVAAAPKLPGAALGLKSPKAAGVTRSAGPVQNAALPAKPQGIFGRLMGKK